MITIIIFIQSLHGYDLQPDLGLLTIEWLVTSCFKVPLQLCCNILSCKNPYLHSVHKVHLKHGRNKNYHIEINMEIKLNWIKTLWDKNIHNTSSLAVCKCLCDYWLESNLLENHSLQLMALRGKPCVDCSALFICSTYHARYVNWQVDVNLLSKNLGITLHFTS